MAGPTLPHLPGFCQLSPKGFFDASSSPASCFSSQAFLLLRPGSRHLSSDSQNHCRDARLPLSLPPPLRSLSLPLLSSFSLEIQILISFLSSGEFRFLFPDFFFFLSISSPPFLRRPDFSFHVDSQPGSSLSLLEFKFLDCCQLSTPLLIARVVLSSFHSVFPHLSVTSCFSFLYFLLSCVLQAL